jgi:hypothetical protein
MSFAVAAHASQATYWREYRSVVNDAATLTVDEILEAYLVWALGSVDIACGYEFISSNLTVLLALTLRDIPAGGSPTSCIANDIDISSIDLSWR